MIFLILLAGIILLLFARRAYSPPNIVIEPVITVSEQEKTPQQPLEPTINEKYAELLKAKDGLKENYAEGECELAAKTFQKVYGGALVFLAPYNIDTGKYIVCNKCGAWVNRIYYKNQILWVDYLNKEIYTSKEGLIRGELVFFQNYRYPNQNIDLKLFVYGEDEMPYPIIWNY